MLWEGFHTYLISYELYKSKYWIYPYKCGYFGKYFSQNTYLIILILRRFDTTREDAYWCETISIEIYWQDFEHNDSFIIHIRIHIIIAIVIRISHRIVNVHIF